MGKAISAVRKMRRFARAGELFGIGLNALPCRLVEKNKYQGVAGLGHRIAALARYHSIYAAGVLRNHVAEAIALDGHFHPFCPMFLLSYLINRRFCFGLSSCPIALNRLLTSLTPSPYSRYASSAAVVAAASIIGPS